MRSRLLGQDWGCLGGGAGSLRAPQMARLCGTAREKLSLSYAAQGLLGRLLDGMMGLALRKSSSAAVVDMGHSPHRSGFVSRNPAPSLESRPRSSMKSGLLVTGISPLLVACLPQMLACKQLPPPGSFLSTGHREKGPCIPSPPRLPFLCRERLCSRKSFHKPLSSLGEGEPR